MLYALSVQRSRYALSVTRFALIVGFNLPLSLCMALTIIHCIFQFNE